jgi:NitT/TauT family transport system substrate-binding protein
MFKTLLAAATAAVLAGSAAVAQPVTARVGVIPIIGAAPIFVADKKGWAKEAGLDLKFTVFESGPNMIQALASGTIDIYVAGVMPLAVARAKGIVSKVVTATAVEEMVFVAGPKLAPYFKDGVAPAQALKDYRAKEGKAARLAAQPPGSVPNTTLQHWLWQVAKAEKAGCGDHLHGHRRDAAGVLVGAVEGAAIREPALTIVQGRNPNIKLVATGGQMFPSQPGTVVPSRPAFAKAPGQPCRASSTRWWGPSSSRQPDGGRAVRRSGPRQGIVDAATIRSPDLAGLPLRRRPARHRGRDGKMQAYQVSIGTLDKEAPLEGLFEPRFYEKAAGK